MMHVVYSVCSVGPGVLIAACLLDLAIGDPKWLPHPVRLTGKAIHETETWMRKTFTTPRGQKIAGVILAIVMTSSVFAGSFFLISILLKAAGMLPRVLAAAVIVYLAATTTAFRDLIRETSSVIEAVKSADVPSARSRLSMLVGRDTDHLDERHILRAAMETLAENLSDGVIAPLLYLALGGIPAAMAYKAINTLDSMVGYKNECYLYLGWASARLDDIANYVPARVTGVLIAAASGIVSRSPAVLRTSFRTMLRDGRKHPSPNSGIPESAMAGAVGITMGGVSMYGGIPVEKPVLGREISDDYRCAARRAISVAEIAGVLGMIMTAALLAVRGIWWMA